jgi:hypothetical protein
MIGAVMRDLFSVRNAAKHFSLKFNGTSFWRRLVNGFVIFEKSLMNLL